MALSGSVSAQEASPGRDGKIKSILANPSLRGAQVGILAKSLATGRVLYQRNAQVPLIPASTNKVVTSAAALSVLGPKFRFRTEIYTDGPVSADGTVTGNLYIKGYGDPSITVEEAWLIAHEIHGHGIRRVTGDLIGDESYFDDVRFYDAWGFDQPRSYATPLGALSFNWNTVQAYVAPAAQANQPAHVTLNPEADLITLVNKVKTCGKCSARISGGLSNNTFVVRGRIPVGGDSRTAFAPVEEPLPFAVSALRKFLEKEGVEIAGADRAGIVPPEASRLMSHKSRELSQILRYLMRFSNNLTAECVQRTVGVQKFGAPATREKAVEAVTSFLKTNGLYHDGIVVDDGSGLSRNNRQSPESLVGILYHMSRQPELFAEYLEMMAIGGVDGTLANRFNNSALEHRVRGKTGYLWGVVTLAGYTWNSAGEPYAFAVMVNDPPKNASVRSVQQRIEEIVLALME
ncbi:MAG: D-alanyl-D-alanine carboxypeptidase/D-alanyl-D-alanine-endopeptidase [Deltaproteobacteria bacterium]|nr:D-alanyl-D-alanine carboxypeptidase/D-alanyl-D-alanine-endopeptidase [Deltaproteobacteria bacterium]